MSHRPHLLDPPPGADLPRRGPGAVFIDLDRTLMAGSSAFEFARAAHRSGLMTRREIARDAWANLSFRLRGSTDAGTARLVDRISGTLAGVRVRDLERMAHDVLAGVLPRLYPDMLAIAYEHQDAGRPVFICTAASQEMGELMALVLTFDGAVGTGYETRDGVYTGRLVDGLNYREGKALAIRALAGREGLDLAQSWAYSDSESDLPMLQAVGHPVAVNPDRALARIAAAQEWPVLRFDRLGARLRVAAALAGAALVGAATVAGGGSPAARRLLARAA